MVYSSRGPFYSAWTHGSILLRAPAGPVVVGSAKRLLVLDWAMREAEQPAGGTAPTDHDEPSTAAEMDINSGGDHAGRDPGAKRRRGGGSGGS